MTLKEVLEESLGNCDNVFIVSHKTPDLDAVMSMMGMASICKKKKKNYYIILDEDIETIKSNNPEVASAIEKFKGDFNIINSKGLFGYMHDGESEEKKNKNLLIVTDTNSNKLIPFGVNELLAGFDDVIIIDHHNDEAKDKHTNGGNRIKTKEGHAFISDDNSSASEMVSELMISGYRIKIQPDFATYMIAAILVDVNHLTNISSNEEKMAASMLSLIRQGGSIRTAEKICSEDIESKRKVYQLVGTAVNFAYRYAISCDRDKKIYKQKDLAKAANELNNSEEYDIVFVIGYINEDTISVSARSKGTVVNGEFNGVIDAGKFMSTLIKILNIKTGGGRHTQGALQTTTNSIDEIINGIHMLMSPSIRYVEQTESPLKLELTCKC